MALSIVIVWSVRTEVVKYWIFALLFIYAHISTMLWISYFMKKKIGKSIKSSFNLGISKIQHFIIPYVLAAVVFTALNFIIMPISKVYTGNLMTIYFIIFLFYFAWLRFYIYSIAKKIA